MALPAASPEEQKKMPCFAVRDGKTCAAGASCPYPHKPDIIAAAKAKAKEREKAKAKAKAQPAAAAPEKAKARAKARAKASASAGTSTTGPPVASKALRAPSCMRPQRWQQGWKPPALLPSRVWLARSTNRLAALALSDKPGRRQRQLSSRPPRASQCGFWIPAPATTW